MRKPLLALLAVVVMVLSACGGAPPMATVNGQEIVLDDLVGLDAKYENAGRFDTDDLVDDLGLYVLLTAIETSARDEFGVEITDADVDELLTAPAAEYVERVATWQAGLAQGAITEGQMREDARSFLIREAVARELGTDSAAVEEMYSQRPEVFATACVRHILTTLEEEAVAAFDRIEAGEDFATVADEVSLDTSSIGGLLADPATGECNVPLSLFVSEFAYNAAVAPIGQITGPFVSDFGWHIIIVEERTAPDSLDEIRADLDTYLTEDVRTALVTPWLNEAIDTAEVEIDPSIGTWSETGAAIIPVGG